MTPRAKPGKASRSRKGAARKRPTIAQLQERIEQLEQEVAELTKSHPVKAKVAQHLRALRRAQPIDTWGEVLGASALNLAEQLDAGEPPTMTATWSRELRMILSDIGLSESGGSEPDGSGDPEPERSEEEAGEPEQAGWLDDLPSQVRDP